MLSIYNYEDPAKFLSAFLNEKQKLDPNYSVRVFSKSLGLNSSAQIVDILKGSKKIKTKLVEKLVEVTSIDNSERMYFEAIIARSQTDIAEKMKMYDLIIQELLPTSTSSFSSMKTSDLNIFSHWIYTAILSLSGLADFDLTITNIKAQLIVDVETSKVEEALFDLFSHGLLVTDSEGRIRKKYLCNTSKSDITHVNVKDYYRMICDLAKKSIDLPLARRELNSFSFPVAQDDVPLAKEIIRKCKMSLIKLSENKNTNQVYQANLMLFPLTVEISDSSFKIDI